MDLLQTVGNVTIIVSISFVIFTFKFTGILFPPPYIKGLLTSIVTNPSKWRVDICNIAVGTHQMFWFYWSISLWGALMVLPSVIFTAGRYLLGVKLLYVGV